MAISRGCVIVPSPVMPLTCVQPNILVDVAGHARITDFRFATVIENSDSMWSDSADQGPIHITRWTAPEILNEQGTYSKEGDVFSFAMVTIEVCRGPVACVWL